MHADTDHRQSPPTSALNGDGPEPVDLDDPDALRRAVALHQAGTAVFAVPFGAAGPGSLTWLDPRTRGAAPQAGGHAPAV